MQTALHIYALVEELKNTLVGAKLVGTEFYKKEREAYLYFKPQKGQYALGLAYHPVGYGSFLIPRGKVQIDTREKPWPFFQPAIEGTVAEIRQYGLDRIFRIDIEKDSENYSIIVEAIGPNGNLWLLDSEDQIIATLRNKKFDPGTIYTAPKPRQGLSPFSVTTQDIENILLDSKQFLDKFLKKNILGLNNTLIDEIITRSGLHDYSVSGDTDTSTISVLANAVNDLAGKFEIGSTGYMYQLADGFSAFPFKLKSSDSEGTKHKSLSLAEYDAVKSNKTTGGEKNQKQIILDAVGRHVKKLRRKVKKIAGDIDGADNFEQYKKTAELIKINITHMSKGMKSVDLEDVYNSDGGTITIKLDPAMTPAENADRYFKKFRKGRDGLNLLQRRHEVADKELDSVQFMLDELDIDFDSASKKYRAEIEQILPAEAHKRETAPRLPYRACTLTTGVTIFVGKDGEDNDRTTFNHAKPYELWFHASQCPGSHVVMKFPDKSFEPSKSEIEETASAAAYHSKARHSKTVPVIYTQRKYVRKPRKAKPGLVTVEREKMVMVEPKKPE